MELGVIISSLDKPNTTALDFLIKGEVKKEQFVKFNAPEGTGIGRVSEIKRLNRLFMEAESVKEYDISGFPIERQFPVDNWEILIGEVEILGVISNEIRRLTNPPQPGTKIYLADPELISKFIGIDSAKGLEIGEIAFHSLNAKLDLDRLIQKHFAILAKSGTGKSYLTAVIIEELLERKEEHGKICTVIIDPHGEYAGFSQDKNYLSKVKVFKSKEIFISTSSIGISDLMRYFPDMGEAQRRDLEKIIKDLLAKNYPFSLSELEAEIINSKINTKTKEILLSRISRLKALKIFGRYDNPKLTDFEQGKLIVLDLSDTTNNKKRQIIVDQIARKLFRARMKNKVPPFLLLIEEAHNFAPEKLGKAEALCRDIIVKIAREGRKFSAAIGLISQRPVHLSTTALSQCNSHIFFRVTNPYDLKHIEESSEGITSSVRKSIPGLRVGECIVVGEAVNHPIFVKVRKRRSMEFSTGKSMTQAALEYAQNSRALEKDLEAFS